MFPRLLLTSALLVAPMSAFGVPGDRPALLDAVAAAPALSAASQRINAGRARIDAAGRLPDPEIEGMVSRADMIDGNADMWELNLRQPLPKRGERAADRDRAHAVVAMLEADYAMVAGDLAADVAMAVAEIDGAHRRIAVLDAQLRRLQAVLESVEVRIAAGGGRIADRLTLQSRLAAMQLMIEQERRMADDAAADARGLLGLAPDAPLPDFAAPATDEIRADEAATLRLAEARIAEANAMRRMARAGGRPMTAVGVRLEREQTAMGNNDTVGLAFMSEIPWRSRRYARAEVRAAEAERDAARADGTSARHRISSTLLRVDRAERLADLARRLAAETRARLDTEFMTFLQIAGSSGSVGPSAMGGGESAVLQAVEILEKTSDTELQVIQAETAARTTRAELWRYAPAELLLQTSARS
jgi:outer membrane protein TolC